MKYSLEIGAKKMKFHSQGNPETVTPKIMNDRIERQWQLE
jgi:hypothetical protein